MAFLDSNALIGLSLYREVCQQGGLAMDAAADFAQFTQLLGASKPPIRLDYVDRPKEFLRQSQQLFMRALDAARKDEWAFVTSRMCMAEMHHTLLEHRGHERLLRKRVPYRLRAERPLPLFRHVLTARDYASVGSEVEGLLQHLLDHFGIPIQIVEDGLSDFRDVVAAAQVIWSGVMMDVVDTVIYSAAVVSMSDVVVTSDNALASAIRSIHQPPDQEWRALKRNLDAQLAGTGHSWPQAIRIQDPLP